MGIISNLRAMANVFKTNMDNFQNNSYNIGGYSSVTPHRQRLRFYNDKSLITAIYNRIAVDVAGIPLRHVLVNEDGQYTKNVKSTLDKCLTLEPNMDQNPRAFRQDGVMTLFDKGVAAIVAVDTEVTEKTTGKFDILTMRIGEIVAWYPAHVRVSLYNDSTGMREEVLLEKRNVAIVENPLYAVMNEPNSTLQRLLRKLTLLDAVDEQSSSGKLDLIIQLPYVVKSEARKAQAEQRRQDIEFQLKGSQYGIAYTDGTERITQLNRPAENQLLKQVEYLTNMLYGQLGITETVMNGTAEEQAMINYYNRTVEPILDAFTEGMQRSLLGNVGLDKGERIQYFRNPFKLIPVEKLAEIADKFTRNEILSANELRAFMGIPPSKDPKADKLMNSNMPQAPTGIQPADMDKIMGEVLDGLSSDLDSLAGG